MSDLLERLQATLSDRYAVEREIGRGGMAIVYLAQDLKHNRKVAIKVLQPELARAIGPERFLQEIEIAAQLTHPNILPLHDSGEADGLLYYVMPYVEDESLRERLEREERLPLEDAIGIVRDVAAALSYAHQQGVIHRDIKPANILLVAGRPVVSDFGIARAVDAAGSKRFTETGLAVRSPGYMSPEQAAGDTALDERTDVYSLGCIAFELLAGTPPFTGTTPQAVLARVLTDPPPSVRELEPTVPAGVERVVQQALAKAPGDRFGSASEFARTLTEANTAQAIAHDALRLRRARRRRFGAGVAAAALFVVVGWWLTTVLGGPRFERLAVLPPTNLMNDPEQDYLVQGMHNGLISELQHAGIPVIPRTSVMQYADTDKSARQIATELGADALVESSVFRAGDSIDVEVKLVDGSTQEYVGDPIVLRADLTNVLALFRDLTGAIASEIDAILTPEAEARLAEAPRVDPEAWEAYVQARHLLDQKDPESYARALSFLEAAVEADSTWADPYAALAGWHLQSPALLQTAYSEAAAEARLAASRALELDSTVAAAHFALAEVAQELDWDWDAAERSFRRGLALSPDTAEGHRALGSLLAQLGRHDEAIGHARRAVELEPASILFRNQLAMVLQMAGMYEEAETAARAALAQDPDHGPGYYRLAWAQYGAGEHEEAVATLEEAYQRFESSAPFLWKIFLAEMYAYTGRERQARELLTEFLEMDPQLVGAAVANIYNGLGESEEAVEWFRRAYEARAGDFLYFLMLPRAARIRTEPEFQEMVRQMDLPATVLRQLDPSAA